MGYYPMQGGQMQSPQSEALLPLLSVDSRILNTDIFDVSLSGTRLPAAVHGRSTSTSLFGRPPAWSTRRTRSWSQRRSTLSWIRCESQEEGRMISRAEGCRARRAQTTRGLRRRQEQGDEGGTLCDEGGPTAM